MRISPQVNALEPFRCKSPVFKCVRLSRPLVGFRTHFKSLHFHSFSVTDRLTYGWTDRQSYASNLRVLGIMLAEHNCLLSLRIKSKFDHLSRIA